MPVQDLPSDLDKALIAPLVSIKTGSIWFTGDVLPNDKILSASMVAYVLEKYGVQDIRIVDGGLAGWTAACLQSVQEFMAIPWEIFLGRGSRNMS
jgi:thiosulfate/3-mercaptopyruvate sulfurtransferase